MPTFKKGDPRPASAGRKPGSRNKKSLLVLEILESNGINLVENILNRLPLLNPNDQIDALISLLPYCYPKLTNIDVSGLVKIDDDRPLKEVSNDDLDAILIDKSKD